MSVSTSADAALAGEKPSLDGLVEPAIRWSILVYVGALLVAAVLLLARRAVGAISQPLPATGLVSVGSCLAATALAVRSIWARRKATTSGSTVAVSCALNLAAVTVAVAVSLPGSSTTGLVWLWLAVVAEAAWAWRPNRLVAPHRPETAPDRSPQIAPAAASEASFQQAVIDSALGEDMVQEHVTQQLARLQEPDGTDRVVGWLRVSFEAGQRLASVHLAFCPPFGRTPEATLQRLDGPQVRIKRIQVLPFGARFDLKLNAPAEQSTAVLLRLAAQVAGHDSSAESDHADEITDPPS